MVVCVVLVFVVGVLDVPAAAAVDCCAVGGSGCVCGCCRRRCRVVVVAVCFGCREL